MSKTLPRRRLGSEVAPARRGAALLLSLLVLLVIVAIAFQIDISTKTDARVANSDITLTRMDCAIESALFQVTQMLRDDAQTGGAAGMMGAAGAGADVGGETGGGPGGESGDTGAAGGGTGAGGEEAGGGGVDSRMDPWGQPQTATIGEIPLRILVQDEDSKYNVLNMLSADEDEAQDAYDRVVRILDACREGTEADIDSARATEMARVMRDHMLERDQSFLPRPVLLGDDEDNERLGLPLTLEEFAVLDPFNEWDFRDFIDAEKNRVHSIGTFLTVWSSPTVGSKADGRGAEPPEGGYAVNVNTAPAAVLKNLFESRKLTSYVWDNVIEYRNLEEEAEDDEEEALEPILNEFGEEEYRRKVFDDLGELEEVYGWGDFQPGVQEEIEAMLTVESHVFSIYVTARRDTSTGAGGEMSFDNRAQKEDYERSGSSLVRTVRCVVWRRQAEEDVQIVPLIRWEVLDYAPLEVLDYPEDSY
jgi:hypothetical protein